MLYTISMNDLAESAIGALGFIILIKIIVFFVVILLISTIIRLGLGRVAKKADTLLLDVISILLPTLYIGVFATADEGFDVGIVITGLTVFDILIFGLFYIVRKIRSKKK